MMTREGYGDRMKANLKIAKGGKRRKSRLFKNRRAVVIRC